MASTPHASALAAADRTATLYRMVLPDHVCPYGLKARHLLRSHGYRVEDHRLTSRDQVEAFKATHNVKTTPQIFIEGRRIGGHDDLRRHLGLAVAEPGATAYTPVVAVFGVAALMALALSYAALGQILTVRAAEWFIGLSMCILAMLKLQDVERFSSMFLNYDLLAKRWVPYAYAYPVLELTAGVLMVAGALNWLSIPIALTIGTIGAVSVFKAVYIDRRELKCACVGGASSVPLGFVSLTENLFMIGMALWMLAAPATMGHAG
jgi:glutaredoxin